MILYVVDCAVGRGVLANQHPPHLSPLPQLRRVGVVLMTEQFAMSFTHRQGQDGAKCVLRAICEVAEAPMEDGVLGDVVNLLLRSVDYVDYVDYILLGQSFTSLI